MDPRFVATPSEDDLIRAIGMWPELAGRRVRPLLVTAFGEIFLESAEGVVVAADPLELTCERVADSVEELRRLFEDRQWAEERLLIQVVLLAGERGLTRRGQEVFAVAPHPSLSGAIRIEDLQVTTLPMWHAVATQLRG